MIPGRSNPQPDRPAVLLRALALFLASALRVSNRMRAKSEAERAARGQRGRRSHIWKIWRLSPMPAPGRAAGCSRAPILLGTLIFAFTINFTACMTTTDSEIPPDLKPGGGSDTETLTGTVRDGSAAPAAGIALKLIPEEYDPRHPDTTSIRHAISDDTGGFAFAKVDTARTYNLIAGDAPARKWAITSGIRPDGKPRAVTLSLAKVFLFSMHSGPYARADSGIAYFPGTDILAHCDGVTASKVDSVPLGALRFIVESRAGWRHDTTLAAAADTTKVSASASKLILIQ